MRNLFQLTLVLSLMASPAVMPTTLADGYGKKEDRHSSSSSQGVVPNQLLSGHTSSISDKHAASLVKERYGSSRILGVSLLDESGPPVYRVRTLSPKGVVKSVFVDGNSGEVFE